MSQFRSNALRPGSVVQSAERDGEWLKIVTTGGVLHCAGAREAMELVCKRCGEWRLVEIIETAKQKVGFCKVCCYKFKLPEPPATVAVTD